MAGLQRIGGINRIVRVTSKKVPVTPPGIGFMWEPDGQEEVFYTVEIDFKAVELMARRAATSKGQRAVDGPLVVTVERRKKL